MPVCGCWIWGRVSPHPIVQCCWRCTGPRSSSSSRSPGTGRAVSGPAMAITPRCPPTTTAASAASLSTSRPPWRATSRCRSQLAPTSSSKASALVSPPGSGSAMTNCAHAILAFSISRSAALARTASTLPGLAPIRSRRPSPASCRSISAMTGHRIGSGRSLSIP